MKCGSPKRPQIRTMSSRLWHLRFRHAPGLTSPLLPLPQPLQLCNMQTLESLPVELIGEIFSVLDLQSLTVVPYLSRRLHHVCSDAQINPWRRPILRNLRLGSYEPCLKTLSVRTVVPRSNWIEILSIAGAHFLLFDATLPNLSDEEWRECFTRRFLPSMQQWKRQSSWREAFKKYVAYTSC